jgi:hypothetical protein
VQVARGRGDVGVAHQTLDDVDVFASSAESRGLGMTSVVGELIARCLGLNSGLANGFVDSGASALLTGASVERVVEEEGRRHEVGTDVLQVLAQFHCQQLGDWNYAGFPSFADQSDATGSEVNLIGAHVDQLGEMESCVAEGEEHHPTRLPTDLGLGRGPLDDVVGFSVGVELQSTTPTRSIAVADGGGGSGDHGGGSNLGGLGGAGVGGNTGATGVDPVLTVPAAVVSVTVSMAASAVMPPVVAFARTAPLRVAAVVRTTALGMESTPSRALIRAGGGRGR